MSEQKPQYQARDARTVLDDLAEIERRLDDGSIPLQLREKAVEARHEMVTALTNLLPIRDDGLGGMTTSPRARVGLPLGTFGSPLDDHDPAQMAAYIETKFGPGSARNFREAMHEAAAHQAGERPEDFSNIPVEEARRLLGIDAPEEPAARAQPAAPAPRPQPLTPDQRARLTAAGAALPPAGAAPAAPAAQPAAPAAQPAPKPAKPQAGPTPEQARAAAAAATALAMKQKWG